MRGLGRSMMDTGKVLFVLALGCAVFSAEAVGAKLLSKTMEKTLEIAAGRSGRTLTKGSKILLGREMLKITARHGDDVLPLVEHGGLEVLEQGIRHGDDFWKLCRKVPAASRSLALHSDELLPLAKRIGPEVLHLEAQVPGLSARFAREFGDEGVRFVSRHSPQDVPRLLGYAAKADSPATKKFFFETYKNSKNPSVFLDALNWKNIMTGGLSAAAIVGAYKVSDGIQTGLRNPEAAQNVINTLLSPVRCILYVLFILLLFPLFFRSLKRSLSAWKKHKA